MAKLKRHWWAVGTAAVLLVYAAISLFLGPTQTMLAVGDLTSLAGMSIFTALSLQNAFRLSGVRRVFWSLIAVGSLLWVTNQAMWTWWEVVIGKPIPDPFIGDIVLFLHLVPFMAAVALQPHHAHSDKNYFDTLSFLMLLAWWVFLYAFIVFPDEYIVLNLEVYSRSYDLLYLLENILVLSVLGLASISAQKGWRRIYWNLFLASALYTVSSEAMNAAIARGQYYSGSLYDIPFLASISWFIWAVLQARGDNEDFAPLPFFRKSLHWLAPRLSMLAMLSLPLMGFWAHYVDASAPAIRKFRLLAVMAALMALALFVFLKQYLLDRELIRLIDDSDRSYENLQRLQTQVVQQEKLASLGELVAGAAQELNYPLTAILQHCEQLSSSAELAEQPRSMTQKIHQQALRTTDLVSDLLQFAQQAPAAKSALEVTSVLHRAVHTQMIKVEGRKIEIKLVCESDLPKVLGNGNQLFTVSLQIIDNAIDALEECGGGSITVTVVREGSDILIEFADTGPGVRDPKRVFDPFYTTKPIGKGTGLGLSAAYGVIHDHDGQISCFNRPERGAVFLVRLPLIEQHQPLSASTTA